MSKELVTHSDTSRIERVFLPDSSSTTGAGLTGLTSASAGLIISTLADNEATATAYTVTGSTIEGITTLGTYAAPTATKCRFREVDATNHPGLYELQFADARYSVANAEKLIVTISGAANLAPTFMELQLAQFDVHVATQPVNLTEMGGVAQSATDLKDFADAGYDPATNKVQGVVLVDTCTTNTDMRGTDGANTTTPLDAAGIRTAVGLAAANMDTQLADIPTVAEFNARTLVAASYFDPATDTVANVTTVATLTGHTAQTGDNYARLGAPAGASVSADVAAVKSQTAAIETDTQDLQTQVGTAGAGLTSLPDVTLANGVTHGGTTAMLELGSSTTVPAFKITNSGGHAASWVSTSAFGAGLQVTGGVGQAGLDARGGSYGALFKSNDVGGNGVRALGDTDNISAFNITDIQTGLATATNLSTVSANVSTLLTRIPASLFSGITSLANWLRVGFRSDGADATALTEIGGTYVDTTDSQQAIRDRGDAAWTTGAGGGGDATASNQTTILNRLGAITGSGDNTVLGFFKSLLSKAAAAPSDIGGTFTPATDSTEAIRDRGDAAWTAGVGTGLTPLASGTAQGGTASTIQLAAGESFADDEPNGNVVKITSGTGAGQSRLITDYVGSTDTATVAPNWTTTPDATSVYEVVDGPWAWNNATRTLTQTAAQVAAAVSGGTITIHRGDKLSASLTGLGSLTGRTKLWVTVKRRPEDADADAIVQWIEGTGLTILNGSTSVTAGNGSVTVDDETAGDITIVLNGAETAQLSPAKSLHYDVQILDASSEPSTKAEGVAVVNADITRATS